MLMEGFVNLAHVLIDIIQIVFKVENRWDVGFRFRYRGCTKGFKMVIWQSRGLSLIVTRLDMRMNTTYRLKSTLSF